MATLAFNGLNITFELMILLQSTSNATTPLMHQTTAEMGESGVTTCNLLANNI